jgi:transcriptional regulator with XRE-family HTH domain
VRPRPCLRRALQALAALAALALFSDMGENPGMETPAADTSVIDRQLAHRLKALRRQRGWSLDRLAGDSGVSRATLSRLENAEVSATAQVLGKLAAAYGLSVSRLIALAEEGVRAHLPADAQPIWRDPESGLVRRTVSPPDRALAGEVVAVELPAVARIAYDRPPRPGLEHHLLLQEGRLTVTLGREVHRLAAGDCLRYRLFGPSVFETPDGTGARYLLFVV